MQKIISYGQIKRAAPQSLTSDSAPADGFSNIISHKKWEHKARAANEEEIKNRIKVK